MDQPTIVCYPIGAQRLAGEDVYWLRLHFHNFPWRTRKTWYPAVPGWTMEQLTLALWEKYGTCEVLMQQALFDDSNL